MKVPATQINDAKRCQNFEAVCDDCLDHFADITAGSAEHHALRAAAAHALSEASEYWKCDRHELANVLKEFSRELVEQADKAWERRIKSGARNPHD